MSWATKYRPQAIKDLHLSSVRNYFLSVLNKGKIPQVLLFAGPKGTGKTSTARIFSAVLNNPKNETIVDSVLFQQKTSKHTLAEPNLNLDFTKKILAGKSFSVQELDAASNRGIDDVRQLKEMVLLPPQEGKVSVYILDEVHMLTTEAFNALLKLLEEPPAHVVFILATTELHKIPDTIVSRCQLVQFSQATTQELEQVLDQVCSAEKLKLETETKERIISQADGSFRDLITALEMQANNPDHLHHSISKSELLQLAQEVMAKNSSAVIEFFKTAREQNVDSVFLHKQLVSVLHADLINDLETNKSSLPGKVSLFLLKELTTINPREYSPIPHLALEIALLDIIQRAQKKSPTPTKKNDINQNQRVSSQKSKPSTTASKPILDAASHSDNLTLAEEIIDTDTDLQTTAPIETVRYESSAAGDGQELCNNWTKFVALVSEENFGIATLLKSAKPLTGSQGKIRVAVYYKFHQEQLSSTSFFSACLPIINQIAGGSVEFEFVLEVPNEKAELIEPEDSHLTELATQTLL